jgi:hypothetical protein
LIELSEGEGGEQFEAARALLLGDGDGRAIGLFRGYGIGGIAFQQDVAAEAIEVRVGDSLTCFLRDRQPLADPR